MVWWFFETKAFCALRKKAKIGKLHNYKFDVIFLQETYSTKEVETIWSSEWGGKIFYSHGSNHSKGVAILFNPKLDVHAENTESDKNGRYLMLETKIYDTTFLFCNIYSPNDNNSQNSFFSSLNGTLQHYADMQIVIGGDFNCALTPLDKTGGTSVERKKTVISEITNLCTTYKLQDVWRLQHPNLSQYTWRNNSLKVQCRLDYWLVSKGLFERACDEFQNHHLHNIRSFGDNFHLAVKEICSTWPRLLEDKQFCFE